MICELGDILLVHCSVLARQPITSPVSESNPYRCVPHVRLKYC
jgi:hypothetical protein